MTLSHSRIRIYVAMLLATVIFAYGTGATAATIEEESIAHIGQLRTINANKDSATIAAYNKKMDDAWRFFYANRSQVVPILRAQLKEEIALERANDLILLDLGLFVYKNDDAMGKAIAADAFAKLNPLAPIILENHQELFDFTHALAGAHDPRALSMIEKAFLPSDQELFVPQHSFRISGSLACVFLYGVYGDESEDILRAKLVEPSLAKRVLEILAWTGSPASVSDVALTLKASPDYDTFVRVTSYMMHVAGAEGRSFMLSLASNQLDEKSRQYFDSILPAIRSSTFETLKAALEETPENRELSDDEVISRLTAMIRNYGRDDNTNPAAILNSKLPKDLLITKLSSVRSSTFHRISNEALGDVEMTNLLINALRYKTSASGG